MVRGLAHSRALVHAVSDGDTWIVMYAPEYVCMPANVCTTVSMYVCMYVHTVLHCAGLYCIVWYRAARCDKQACMHACMSAYMYACM